jgi:hypothetical protein
MTYIADLQRKVDHDRANTKFNEDLAKNLSVIEMRMRVQSTAKFALYNGGDSQRMLKELQLLGLSKASVDNIGTVWGQL